MGQVKWDEHTHTYTHLEQKHYQHFVWNVLQTSCWAFKTKCRRMLKSISEKSRCNCLCALPVLCIELTYKIYTFTHLNGKVTCNESRNRSRKGEQRTTEMWGRETKRGRIEKWFISKLEVMRLCIIFKSRGNCLLKHIERIHSAYKSNRI